MTKKQEKVEEIVDSFDCDIMLKIEKTDNIIAFLDRPTELDNLSEEEIKNPYE